MFACYHSYIKQCVTIHREKVVGCDEFTIINVVHFQVKQIQLKPYAMWFVFVIYFVILRFWKVSIEEKSGTEREKERMI